jgi:amino acid adenylation domain-containing protein
MDNVETFYPLSPMQQGMLFHAEYAGKSSEYLRRMSCVLKGDLDAEAFWAAWEHALRRHSVLRTGFVWEGTKEPVQVVYHDVVLPWKELDWSDLPAVQQQAQLERLIEADQELGFDLTQPPLTRCTMIRLAARRYQFIWTLHHILLDGWSVPLLLKEVFTSYEALCRHEALESDPPKPYRDFIVWLRQRDQRESEAFWRSYLAGFTSPTPLVVDRKSSGEQSMLYEKQEVTWPANQTAELRHSARRLRVTLGTLIQGAWGLLLARYSGESEVMFGATVSGRPSELAGSDAMLGLFINTLPVRMRVPGKDAIAPWLERLQMQQAEVRAHQYSSLLDIQRWSDVQRGEKLFESIVVFENYPTGKFLGSNSSLSMHDVDSMEWNTLPLTLQVLDGDELKISLLYGAVRFERDAIARMLQHFQNLLSGMASDSTQPLSALRLLNDRERHEVLVDWNDTRRECPEVPIHHLIEQQAERTPDHVAAVFGGKQLRYAELNQRANQVAHFLRTHYVGPELLVGVCMERSLEMVIALLGVLKAGGAYVPIDPDYPKERIEFMLQDAEPLVLLTQEHLACTLPATSSRIVCLDRDWSDIGVRSSENCASGVTTENLAYVIYTSGSTGQPKGAMNTHHGLVNRLLWMQREYGLSCEDRVMQKTPFSFDVSVWEFFWPLMTGACLIVAHPGGHRDPGYLVELIAREKVTTLHFVPSMLHAFLQETDLKPCHSLKRVISSGEALSCDLQEEFFSRLDCELHNLYGPTEASIDVTYWKCERGGSAGGGGSVPIGRPIANTQIYILDRDLNPVPVGVPGELHIGGVGLARGYWRRAELTKEKFIADPFSPVPGARLYKSGDLARYRADGVMEYLGRLDQQVKIRGQRIELGEIEATLKDYPGASENVVIVREDTPGDKRLIAYLVTKDKSSVSLSELRSFLNERLPEHMVPSAFVLLDALPLSPNGKLDRRALPAPEPSRPELENRYVEPRTAEEIVLARIWADVLKVDKIGVQDNFFELGGDSILSMQIVWRLKQAGL